MVAHSLPPLEGLPRLVLARLPDQDMLESLNYGEAPASTAKKALEFCQEYFPQATTLVDLGAGRGVLCMTAAALGWNVLAVEYLNEFIRRSEPVTRSLGWSVEWVQGDFCDLPVPSTDLIHTSATEYPESTRAALAQKLSTECHSGQAILTQDWVLEDPRFEVLASQRWPVTWGTALFTLHRAR